MRKHVFIIWCLTGVAGFCLLAEQAMGQAGLAAPPSPQYVQYPQGAPPVTPGVPTAQVALTADQIDQLVGPIALYPDPLLSLIFPAASYPQDVIAAEQWLGATPNPTEADIDAQSWDPSIKGLVHYPTVLQMMSDQSDWTQALGAAFVNQQPDVLNSVQRLRAQAQAAQNLQTNAQEQVVADGDFIRIEPVDPTLMYVPQYDPDLVYSSRYAVTFGDGYAIGLWCDDDFDWNHHYVVYGGGWYRGWHHPEAWDRNPPAWDRHSSGWSAAPRQWQRSGARPAPRLTSTSVSRLNLNRPRGSAAVNPARNTIRNTARPLSPPLPVGRNASPAVSKNAFNPTNSRTDVQRSVQRARPTSVAPTHVAPTHVTPTHVTPTHVTPARTPAHPAAKAPAKAPASVFHTAPAKTTRAQSVRGNTSVKKK